MLNCSSYKLSDSPKLDDRWIGPYKITKVLRNDIDVQLDIGNSNLHRPVSPQAVSPTRTGTPAAHPRRTTMELRP